MNVPQNVHHMLEELNHQQPGTTVTEPNQGVAEPCKLNHWETARFRLVDLGDSMSCSAAEWSEHRLAEIKCMNGMVGGECTMHAQVLWGRELWNKSDIQVEMMWTNNLYKAVCKHMQNHREKDLKAEMTQVHQGNGKDVQMIAHGLKKMQLQLQGSTPVQDIYFYFLKFL